MRTCDASGQNVGRVNVALPHEAFSLTLFACKPFRWTSQHLHSAIEDGSVIEVLPTLEFDLHYNTGFSFGTGTGMGRWIAILVVVLCLVLVHQIRVSETALRANLAAVVLGGALGNLADRLFRAEDGPLSGAVIDFIDVTRYAVFNVADILVVCGCIAFGVHELVMARRLDAALTAADLGADEEPEEEPAT